MNDIYSHYYSNSRHDSYINVALNCKGELNWEKEFPGYAEKHLENRLILVSDGKFIIDNMSEIWCLDASGNLLWKRDKWYGTQVIVKDKIIYYTTSARRDRMEAVSLDNKLVLEDFILYEIVEGSYMQLFEPIKNDEIIAQVQYTGVQEASIDKLVVYKIGKKSLGYDWSKMYLKESCPFIPLINAEKGFFLTATHSDVFLIDIHKKERDIQPEISFPVPSKSGNIFVSSSIDGVIYFGYCEQDKVTLKCYDLKGKELYKVESQEEYINFNKVIAPPLIVNDLIYLLTTNKIICIQNKKIKWTYDSKGLAFSFATGLADNSLLVAQTNKIINITSDNRLRFSYAIKDVISAPPVVDKNGFVYFCSKTKMYSLK